MMLNSELLFRPTQHSQESEYNIVTVLTDVHRKTQIIVIKISLTEFPEKVTIKLQIFPANSFLKFILDKENLILFKNTSHTQRQMLYT